MIASIKGKLVAKRPRCIVAVGGFGVELLVPEKDLELLDEGTPDVAFHTYFHVREDKLTLFGFLRREERELFTRLIDVSGIGPKIALGILSAKAAEKIVAAIRQGEIGFLVSIPGLGRKSAERLVMELKDKLDDLAHPAEEPEGGVTVKDEVILALTALGMSRSAAERAMENIEWDTIDKPSVEEVVREALRHASGF